MNRLAPSTQAGRVEVLGVSIDALTLDDLLGYIADTVNAGRRAIIAYANAHALNLACEQPRFRQFLNQSDKVFCDGFGVKWAAGFLGRPLPARFTPPDMIRSIAGMAESRAYSLFFLGGRPGVAGQAAVQLRKRFPELQIVGVHHGYFDKSSGSAENEAVLEAINTLRPDILMVGFGMPLQEQWLEANWGRLYVKVAMTVGAFFDYVSGAVPRGPRWMTEHGLEWLARLLIEPRRLWKRYLIGNPLFVFRVLRQKAGLWRAS